MPEVKPSVVPEWNTGGDNRVTPNAAKITQGWELSEAPSSAFFNDRMFRYGTWLKWIAERLFDGSSEKDLVVSAPNTNDTPGDATLKGGTGGTDADVDAGDAIVRPGDARGDGYGSSSLQAIDAGQGSGTGVRQPTDYFKADGQNRRLNFMRPGFLVPAALHTAPVNGMFQALDSLAGRIATRVGGLWERNIGRAHFSRAAPSSDNDFTTEQVLTSGSFSIPAGSVEVGSVVRFRAVVYVNSSIGSGDTFTARLRLGGLTGHVLDASSWTEPGVGGGSIIIFEGHLIFVALGVTGEYEARVNRLQLKGASGAWGGSAENTDEDLKSYQDTDSTPAIDTTSEMELVITGQWSEAAALNRTAVNGFSVDMG